MLPLRCLVDSASDAFLHSCRIQRDAVLFICQAASWALSRALYLFYVPPHEIKKGKHLSGAFSINSVSALRREWNSLGGGGLIPSEVIRRYSLRDINKDYISFTLHFVLHYTYYIFIYYKKFCCIEQFNQIVEYIQQSIIMYACNLNMFYFKFNSSIEFILQLLYFSSIRNFYHCERNVMCLQFQYDSG